MSGLLGTRASPAADLNLLIQIVIFILLMVGVKFAREKTKEGLKKHGRIMAVAVVLNAASIFFAMGPSFVVNFGAVLAEVSTISFPLTMLHHLLGLAAEVLGVVFIFKKFGKVRFWMRVTMALWLVSLILGFFFYYLYYII